VSPGVLGISGPSAHPTATLTTRSNHHGDNRMTVVDGTGSPALRDRRLSLFTLWWPMPASSNQNYDASQSVSALVVQ